MRKRKSEKKMSVSRETLRQLSTNRLDGIAGGATFTCATCFSRCGQHTCLTCDTHCGSVCHTC